MTHEDRPRFTLDEALKELQLETFWIRHLLDNGDGTYSIMSHIPCDWCDYCETQGNAVGKVDIQAVPFQNDPREHIHKAYERERAEYLENILRNEDMPVG